MTLQYRNDQVGSPSAGPLLNVCRTQIVTDIDEMRRVREPGQVGEPLGGSAEGAHAPHPAGQGACWWVAVGGLPA